MDRFLVFCIETCTEDAFHLARDSVLSKPVLYLLECQEILDDPEGKPLLGIDLLQSCNHLAFLAYFFRQGQDSWNELTMRSMHKKHDLLHCRKGRQLYIQGMHSQMLELLFQLIALKVFPPSNNSLCHILNIL